MAYGSATASVVSDDSYHAAERLHHRLQLDLACESSDAVYCRELVRIRQYLIELLALPSTTQLVFSASGTDVHHCLAKQLSRQTVLPPRIIMIEANETGKGVAAALKGEGHVELCTLTIRQADGQPKPQNQIDAEAESLVYSAVTSGQTVLLIVLDQSKTGLIAPSLHCVVRLQQRFKEHLVIFVDACQFRIAAATLRAYLAQGFLVALTGSKFLTGPSFSAALLSAQPHDIALSQDLPPVNFGLLMRWEIALYELQTFQALPVAEIERFLAQFAEAIDQALCSHACFEALPVPKLDRLPLITTSQWDHIQSIFPFLLYHTAPKRMPLSTAETVAIYQQVPISFQSNDQPAVATARCQLGQPVACGSREGIEVSALRLCLSARLIVNALRHPNQGEIIIADALTVLAKTAWLIHSTEPHHVKSNL